jgi:hypothetical protein
LERPRICGASLRERYVLHCVRGRREIRRLSIKTWTPSFAGMMEEGEHPGHVSGKHGTMEASGAFGK